jgi:multisite-specific tRNA:(cytosine-C5)-methyltransferase
LTLLQPYITEQIPYASAIDFQHLVHYRIIKFPDFMDAKFGEEASALLEGLCVLILREGTLHPFSLFTLKRGISQVDDN